MQNNNEYLEKLRTAISNVGYWSWWAAEEHAIHPAGVRRRPDVYTAINPERSAIKPGRSAVYPAIQHPVF